MMVATGRLGGLAGRTPARRPRGPVYATGKIVPIPASIPHEEGDMVDRRILPDLRWIAERFPIYVTDGYSGPLPGGGRAGCNRCHTRHSDHYNGLAVDIVPEGGGHEMRPQLAARSRSSRTGPSRSRTNPVPPFRWVGYDGDAGHGCGHHLHLSWNHAIGAPSTDWPNGSKSSPPAIST